MMKTIQAMPGRGNGRRSDWHLMMFEAWFRGTWHENPQATFKGKIQDSDNVDFTKNGEYEVTVSGTMMINGAEQEVSQKGSIKVSSDKVSLNSEFDLTLADYGVAFEKGKPSKNIAKTIKITVNSGDIEPVAAAGA